MRASARIISQELAVEVLAGQRVRRSREVGPDPRAGRFNEADS
jgi:hypothetical protein